MKLDFCEVFDDYTSRCRKIPKEKYLSNGKYIVIDQGQNNIAGYTNTDDGLFEDVPAIVFGDHTRIIKYVDEPFFLGADGVKLLKSKIKDANYKYLYYALRNARIPDTGYNRHFKWLKEINLEYKDAESQKNIVKTLDTVTNIIELYKVELSKLDNLIRARFVEMFGDPVSNNKKWIMNTFGEICRVRQGLQIPISKRLINYEEGCYEYITVQYINGGKDREYIKNPKPTVICMEDDILMARTGNTGKVITGVRGVFHNNFLKIEFDRKKYNNAFIVQYLNLDFIKADIIRRAGVSTIPDLNHGEFYKIKIFEPPIELQNKFATFVSQVNKSKLLAASQLQIHIYKTLTLL